MKLKLTKGVNILLPAGTILECTDVTVVPVPVPAPTPAPHVPTIIATPFSDTSIWKKKLSGAEVVSQNSPTLVKDMVDFNTNVSGWINCKENGQPFYTLTTVIPKVPVDVREPGQASKTWTNFYKECIAGLPIPTTALPSLAGDGNCTIYYKPEDMMIECWQLRWESGKPVMSWGAVLHNVSQHPGFIPLVTNSSGGPERQGARACGLTLWGGVTRESELASGVIPHAVVSAPPYPARTFVAPAVDTDGYTSKQAWMPSWMWATPHIPEGQLFRFPANIVIDPAWTPWTKMHVVAIRDYGLYIVDKSDDRIIYSAESLAQYGKGEEAYFPYFGGKQIWDVVKEMPYSKLVALVGK